MRTILHRLLVILAMPPLLLAFLSLGMFSLLAVAADRVLPDARWGNCWTYAVAKWHRYGGYIALRWADGIRVLKMWRVPHALWQPSKGVFRMTYPKSRKEADFLPIHALLHHFEVWHDDSPHPADWVPSSLPEAWQDTTRKG